MTKIDQFESVFKSAAKTVFHLSQVPMKRVLVVADMEEYPAKLFADRVRNFLNILTEEEEQIIWRDVHGEEFKSVGGLLEMVEKERPDLIVTYRNLHSEGWMWSYSLGDYLNILTQATTTPVLVLPRPDQEKAFEDGLEGTHTVMAVTDHLTGDDNLVSWAVRFTARNGRLLLSHVEDRQSFDRMLEAISKLPSIDTDVARQDIHDQLLKEPADFIRSVHEVLKSHQLPLSVEPVVTMGHHLKTYKKMIEDHQVDLLVFNTKDTDQMAMHGLAYPLAVELRDIPLLML